MQYMRDARYDPRKLHHPVKVNVGERETSHEKAVGFFIDTTSCMHEVKRANRLFDIIARLIHVVFSKATT